MPPVSSLSRSFQFTGLLLILLLTACREEVVHGVDESRANRIVAVLESLEIKAIKKRESDGSWTILVTGSDSSRVIRTLADRRLLPIERSTPDGGDGMLPSREGQGFRLERKMSAAIEETLRAVRGVLDARVHLNLGAQRDLFDPRLPTGEGKSGSVLLIVTSDYNVPLADIAALVGQSAGIHPSAVAIVHSIEAVTASSAGKELRVVPAPQADNWNVSVESALVGFGSTCVMLWVAWLARRRANVRLAVTAPIISSER